MIRHFTSFVKKTAIYRACRIDINTVLIPVQVDLHGIVGARFLLMYRNKLPFLPTTLELFSGSGLDTNSIEPTGLDLGRPPK
jgi:hypothetical protein